MIDLFDRRSYDPDVPTPFLRPLLGMGNYRKYGGVSRQVRKTTLNASPGLSLISEPVRVSAVLGFKGKAAERERVQERVRQQYAGKGFFPSEIPSQNDPSNYAYVLALNAEGRTLLQEIQKSSGTFVEGEIPLPDGPPDDNNDWIDEYGTERESEHSEESSAVIQAVRDMRLTLSVVLLLMTLFVIDIMQRLRRRRRGKDTRTWRDRRQNEYRAWDPLIQPLTDAYVKWKFSSASPLTDHPSATAESNVAGNCPLPNESVEYSLDVYELFGMETTLTINRPASSTSVAVDIAEHGFLAKTPILPNAAVGFRTLELFHRLRLRKASFSVEAFTRVLCDYYLVCYFMFVNLDVILTLLTDTISTLSAYNLG